MRKSSTTTVTRRPRVASFFAGIGGFDLGFQLEGFEPVFHSEIDPFCQSVLRRHWPDTILRGDIASDFDPDDVPDAEVWTAGFPCQDVSLARTPHGDRVGLAGSRSGLFHHFASMVESRRPRFVLLENVNGLLNSNKGDDFQVILEHFVGLGYGVAWRVVNSRYFGAPQSRPRVFICASLGGVRPAARSLFEEAGSSKPKGRRNGFIRPSPSCDSFPVVPEVAFCLSATSARHTGMDWARSYVSYYNRVRRLTPSECEGLQTFPVDWTIPHSEVKEAVADLDTPRYHALGNAVTVKVVQWIARRMLSECISYTEPLLSRNGSFDEVNYICQNAIDPLLMHHSAEVISLGESATESSAQSRGRWLSGGVAFRQTCLQARLGPAPSRPLISDFGEVIEQNDPNERYFLSPNAAEGILARVSRRRRTLFRPLQNALERLAGREPKAVDLELLRSINTELF